MVANGQGISILPKPLVDKFNNSRVHQIHLENPSFTWTLSLIRKRGTPVTTPVQCFWSLCENDQQ
jgi:DNA-binding transcriptional LysR family regulator